MYQYNHHFGGMHFWWWLIGAFVIIGFFIFFVVVYFIKPNKEAPLEILKRRYARGEIGKDEFESAKKALKEGE